MRKTGYGRVGERVIITAAALAIAFVMHFAAADERLTSMYSVELLCGKHLSLSDYSSTVLVEAARKLLESSEYNSRSPSWNFPISEVQEEYHRALEGEHLRVVFIPAEKITFRGGSVRVREIIVRLSSEERGSMFPDHFVDSVFTLDDQEEVTGYALYSGLKAIELWRAVAQVTGDSTICHLPTRLPEVPETNAR